METIQNNPQAKGVDDQRNRRPRQKRNQQKSLRSRI